MHLHQCLLLLLAVVLLASAPLAAGQHGNEPAFTEQLALAGDQCSLLPSPSMLKHDPTHCGQQNSTLGAQDAYWHALVFNAAFVYSEAQCGSSQGPACMQRGSLELPFTKLAEAIGEAQRTGADLLLLSDIDDDVVFPAGLSVHGRASPVVAKYMNQVYSSSSPTELSGAVTVRSAGGAGVGGAPTMLVGLELSGSIELDGYFGSGVWFASNLVSVPISGDEVSGEVVVTRNVLNLIGAPLFNLNTAGTWMPTANTTVAMTVDCNMIDGASTVASFLAGNRAASVLVDVHDNFFEGAFDLDLNVQFAGRLYQRVARNHFNTDTVTVSTANIDEQVVLFGQNLVDGPTDTTFSLAGDLIHQATYGTLFYTGDVDSTALASGQQGMLVAHRDNRHVSSGSSVSILATFAPAELDQSARPSAALSLERNQFIGATTSGLDFATIVRQLPGASPSRGIHTLLSTASNFVASPSPGSRLASLVAPSSVPVYSADHLSAVRAQGDWLEQMNGVQLSSPGGRYLFASTYSLEVRHAVGDQMLTLADLYVEPTAYGLDARFVFHVLDSVVHQSSGAPNAAATFILPTSLYGGQTDVYIARNLFSLSGLKKRSAAHSLRTCASNPVTETDPTTIYGPHLNAGTKKRSASVPYTVPYIGGLTFGNDAHHSFRFVENQVSRPGDQVAATFDFTGFEFYASADPFSTGGHIAVEAHIDRNHFYTSAPTGASAVAQIAANSAAAAELHAASTLELTIDNNVFRADSGVALRSALLSGYWQGLAQQNVNLRESISYNSFGHVPPTSPVLQVSSSVDLSGTDQGHDVYRLNYDCELRGNQVSAQEAVATSASVFDVAHRTLVSADRPIQTSQRAVLDDNHFAGDITSTGEALLDSLLYTVSSSSVFPARSSALQSTRARGNYVAASVSSYSHVAAQTYAATDFESARLQSEAASNQLLGPFTGAAAVFLAGASSIEGRVCEVRVADNQIAVGPPIAPSSYAVASYFTAPNGRGTMAFTDNQLLAHGASSHDGALFALGDFNSVLFDGNQLRGMDDNVQTFSSGFVASLNSDVPLQATFSNNAVRHVSVGDIFLLNGATTDSSDQSSFSVTNNHFRRVDVSSNALEANLGVGGSATVCGTLSGNTFLYTSNSDATFGADLEYYQVAGDGFNVVAGASCTP